MTRSSGFAAELVQWSSGNDGRFVCRCCAMAGGGRKSSGTCCDCSTGNLEQLLSEPLSVWAVRLSLIAGWIAGNTKRPEGVTPADMDEALMRLPLSDVDTAIGWPMPWLDAYLTHPEPNGFWTRLDLTSRLPELQIPALHVVGYYDFFSRESVDTFVIMQQQAHDPETRRQQRLILGPWDHGTIGKSKVADLDFGPAAELNLMSIQLDWFDDISSRTRRQSPDHNRQCDTFRWATMCGMSLKAGHQPAFAQRPSFSLGRSCQQSSR